MHRHTTLTFLAIALAGVPATAAAQPAPGHQPAEFQRDGFLIGFGLGGGAIVPDCNGCESLDGPGVEIHIGGMLTPQVGLMFDTSVVVASFDDGSSINHNVYALAVQYWASPRFWLKGGLGLGQLSADDSSGSRVLVSDQQLALLGALGYEVYQGRSFALDLSLRLGIVKYEATVTNVAFMLGFNWY
jgi:hypothetical protein